MNDKEVIRKMEAQILSFFNRLRIASEEGWHTNSTEKIEASFWMKEFKEHFDIKVALKGEIK